VTELAALAEAYSAHNYHPLPLVVAEAKGAWVTDVGGQRYLDMVAAYSAMNFGHRHPQLLQAARAQLERVTLTSRAIYHDRFGPFCKALAELCGMDAVLLMNTGGEAVETAIKTAASGLRGQGGSRPTGPRSSPAPTASTAAPSPW
jgi:ornithine--oxo-acid transaminase